MRAGRRRAMGLLREAGENVLAASDRDTQRRLLRVPASVLDTGQTIRSLSEPAEHLETLAEDNHRHCCGKPAETDSVR